LVDQARRKRRPKHGGGRQRVDLEEAASIVHVPPDDLLALDEALTKLAAEEPIKAKLVTLRLFAGMPVSEAATAPSMSTRTAERYWTYARVWLYAELNDGQQAPGG